MFSFWCFILALAAHVSCQDLSPDVAESLLTLMTEERTFRTQIENEADQLEQELNNLKALRQNVTCGCDQSEAPIAFTATLSHNIQTFGRLQIIVFDNVNLNLGNGYDVRHGTFTAPVRGVYEFTAAILVPGGITTGAEIIHNDQPVAKFQCGDNSFFTMATNVIDLQLEAGDEVYVRHQADRTDNNRIYGENHTSFSGYLIEGSATIVHNTPLSSIIG